MVFVNKKQLIQKCLFRYIVSARNKPYSECFLFQNKCKLNEETNIFGNEQPHNGMDILPLRSTSGCHGNHSLSQKIS